MKMIRFTALIVALSLMMCGCAAAPHVNEEFHIEDGTIAMPETTPVPTPAPVTESEEMKDGQKVGAVHYDPMCVPSAFAHDAQFSAELYRLLVTAVRGGEKEADFSALNVNEEQFNTVRKFLVTRNPWGNVSDITKGEGAKAVITYLEQETPAQEPAQSPAPETTPQPAEPVDTVKRFDDAAELMLQTVVEEESTQLAAAIALYKHLAQQIETDFETADYGIYSAAVQGKSTVTSLANLYSFMLDQIGVENVVVTSEDGSHAWNVLTIEGRSFHCDVQMEAGLNGGQALAGFGLSDADVARMNGWNTWVSENATLLTCAETLMEDVNAAAFADVDAAGNAVYFNTKDNMDGLWRMDLATGVSMQLTQEPVAALAVLGEHIYYLAQADGMLYSYRMADGAIYPVIEGVKMVSMRRVGTEVRYIAADDATQTENAISIE